MDTETGRVKLTDLAACGGCAAKYSAARLEELLAGFVPVEAENLLVGLAPADGAAAHRLRRGGAPEPAPRACSCRRRGGLPARRRARADLHARLLPTGRRRPGGLRSDRR